MNASQFTHKNGVGFIGERGPAGSKRIEINGQVKAALNAFSEMVLGDRYKYHEVGLHLKVDPFLPEFYPQEMANAGYVSQEYQGDLVAKKQGWAPVYIEAWTLHVGTPLVLRDWVQDEPEWCSKHRRSIRKMNAMDDLVRGTQLVLLPSFNDRDGKFSIESAERYFEDILNTLSLPVSEARALINDKIANKRVVESNGRLGRDPQQVNALAVKVATVGVVMSVDGEQIKVVDLLGKTIRRYQGKVALGGLVEVTDENLAFTLASIAKNRLAVEFVEA